MTAPTVNIQIVNNEEGRPSIGILLPGSQLVAIGENLIPGVALSIGMARLMAYELLAKAQMIENAR